jgi:hypothetical protein
MSSGPSRSNPLPQAPQRDMGKRLMLARRALGVRWAVGEGADGQDVASPATRAEFHAIDAREHS